MLYWNDYWFTEFAIDLVKLNSNLSDTSLNATTTTTTSTTTTRSWQFNSGAKRLSCFGFAVSFWQLTVLLSVTKWHRRDRPGREESSVKPVTEDQGTGAIWCVTVTQFTRKDHQLSIGMSITATKTSFPSCRIESMSTISLSLPEQTNFMW